MKKAPAIKFTHAGVRADRAPLDPAVLAQAEEDARTNGTPMVVQVDHAPYRMNGGQSDPLQSRYLIPYYERQGSHEERKEAMLQARINRFFGTAQPNINVARTTKEMDQELKTFIESYGRIRSLGHFSLDLGYGEMKTDERQLVHKGSMLVGHIVNRLGRAGRIILHGGDTKGEGTMEDICELIARWSDHKEEDLKALETMHKPERDALRRELLIKDFQYWADILTKEYAPGRDPIFTYEGKGDIEPDAGVKRMLGVDAPLTARETRTFPRSELMRCAITGNDLRDHDGTLSYLVYEIRKIMNDVLYIEQHEQLADANPNIPHFKPKETRAIRDRSEMGTIDGIVTSIGLTCRAIDETYDGLEKVLTDARFQKFIRHLSPHDADSTAHQVGDYPEMMKDYVELARRRCSINSRDASNFDTAKIDCDHMHTELRWLQDSMRKQLDALPSNEFGFGGKKPLREALDLLSRGLELIHSMAEERIPKNRNAPEVYDKHLPHFQGRDASSVGRFREKVDNWSGNARGRVA